MLELLPLTITVFVIIATFFLAKKNAWGWICYGIANVITIVYGSLLTPYAWGLVVQGVVYMGLCSYGLWNWEKKEGNGHDGNQTGS